MRLRNTDHVDGSAAHGAGPSLARGPALIIGSILVAAGLIGLISSSDFPSTAQQFPDGTAVGEELVGIETNGWTNWLAIACGALLMFGAAQHLMAKTLSAIVACVLGAAAIISGIDGDILGLGAANWLTSLILGGFAVALLVTALLPRRERHVATRDVVDEEDRAGTGRPVTEPDTAPERPATGDREAATGRFARPPAEDRDAIHAGDTRVESGDPLRPRT